MIHLRFQSQPLLVLVAKSLKNQAFIKKIVICLELEASREILSLPS